jgi:hypothetical protein
MLLDQFYALINWEPFARGERPRTHLAHINGDTISLFDGIGYTPSALTRASVSIYESWVSHPSAAEVAQARARLPVYSPALAQDPEPEEQE